MACHLRDRVGDQLIRRSRISDIFSLSVRGVDLYADHLIRGNIRLICLNIMASTVEFRLKLTY